jgi:DNA-binding CsgD family transcriptional regulator
MDANLAFVGRHEELELGERLLDDLGAGRSGSLIVVGQAGAGKTRLLNEIVGRAKGRGIVTAWTTCLPLNAPLPFDPLLDLLAQLRRGGADVAMPERGREGQEIFSSIRNAIESAGENGPVLLIADDLQWSDAATRDMIHYCVARLADLNAGWLLGARPERDAKSFVRRLTRDGLSQRLSLTGFSLEETGDLAAAVLGPEVLSEDLVTSVFRRTQGDPFLSVELLRSLDASEAPSLGSDAIPATVTEMVEDRMESLDEAQLDLLAWASVLPEPMSPKWLSILSSGDQVQSRAEKLFDLGFLAPSNGGWVFSHALVRDAVYATVESFDRTSRHGRVADLLRDLPLIMRAPQLVAAGRLPEAAEAYVKLGYEAWLRGGPDDAASLYGQASSLADEAGATTVRVTARVGEVLSLLRIGAPEARAKGERLRAAMRSVANDEERLSFLSQYAVALWDEISDLDSALAALDEAQGLMESVEGEVLAEAALARAYVLDRAGRPAEALPFAQQALEVARREDDRYLEVRALNCLGLALGQTSGTANGIATLEQAVVLARDEGLPKEAGLACLNLSYLYQVGGDEDKAEEYARVGVAIPNVPAAVEALLRGNAALGPMNRGELQTALADLLTAQAVAARAGRRTEERIMVQRCYVHIMLGELETAERVLADLSFPRGSWEFYRLLEPRGMLLEEWERLPEALSVFLEADAAGDHPVSMWCLAGAIRVAAKLGELEVAESSLRRFESRAGRWEASPWLLDASRGYVELAREKGDDAATFFSNAASTCPEAFHRVRLQLQAALTVNDRDGVMDAIDAYDSMGSTRASDRARSEARALGMRPGRRRTPPGSMSDREREIAKLVAAGRTNAEIAERLFLSPRTVERHVSNVLDKLGYRSRVELAAEMAAGRVAI